MTYVTVNTSTRLSVCIAPGLCTVTGVPTVVVGQIYACCAGNEGNNNAFSNLLGTKSILTVTALQADVHIFKNRCLTLISWYVVLLI